MSPLKDIFVFVFGRDVFLESRKVEKNLFVNLWESKALVYEDRMLTGIVMSIKFMWIDV